MQLWRHGWGKTVNGESIICTEKIIYLLFIYLLLIIIIVQCSKIIMKKSELSSPKQIGEMLIQYSPEAYGDSAIAEVLEMLGSLNTNCLKFALSDFNVLFPYLIKHL